MPVSELGKRVLLLRRAHKYTQAELGRIVGLAANTIARLERGEVQDLRAMSVWKLAEVFDVSIDYLVGRENGTQGNQKASNPCTIRI